MCLLPPLCLTGAQILRNGEMRLGSVAFADGRLADARFPAIDLSGFLVLPGIIDLHGDGFERHLAPRPSAQFSLEMALGSYDREAAVHGVTTAFLAQGWSWEGGYRSPDAAEALMRGLDAYASRALTDFRLQIRAETHLVTQSVRLIEAVRRHRVGYVVFNDHLGQAQLAAKSTPDRFAAWARKFDQTPAELFVSVDAAAKHRSEVPRSLCMLAESFDALGVRYGSHDDPNGETRDFYAKIGADIAEFPLTRRAATAARAMSSPVIMGAPNVVRGGSQVGNVSAIALLEDGLCDVLVSDYHIPSLAVAAWGLVDRGLMQLPQAWALISSRPAEVMRLTDRGRLEPGMRADLVVINAASRAVEATISGGRLSYLAGVAARRFVEAGQVLRMAAE